jgi:TM2 domain-containing membrane protein YozV
MTWKLRLILGVLASLMTLLFLILLNVIPGLHSIYNVTSGWAWLAVFVGWGAVLAWAGVLL